MRKKDDMIFMELDNHDKYEKLLFQLRKLSKYVQLIQIDGYNNKDPHILIADQTLEKTDMGETRAWLGTTRRGKASFQHRYRITDKSFFDYLMQFENFFNLEGTVNKISLKVLERMTSPSLTRINARCFIQLRTKAWPSFIRTCCGSMYPSERKPFPHTKIVPMEPPLPPFEPPQRAGESPVGNSIKTVKQIHQRSLFCLPSALVNKNWTREAEKLE